MTSDAVNRDIAVNQELLGLQILLCVMINWILFNQHNRDLLYSCNVTHIGMGTVVRMMYINVTHIGMGTVVGIMMDSINTLVIRTNIKIIDRMITGKRLTGANEDIIPPVTQHLQ